MQADMKFAIVPAATAESEARQIGFSRRREGSDTADLDRNRGQVRESAEGIGRDHKRARIHVVLMGPSSRNATNSFSTRRVPRRSPTVAQSFQATPRSQAIGAKRIQEPLHRRREPSQSRQSMQPAEDAVRERNQGNKGDQHAADIQGELETITRPSSRGVDDVHTWLLDFDVNATGSCRGFRFGIHDFGEHDRRRRGHDYGRQQVLDIYTCDFDVRRHYCARHVRHSTGHDGEQLTTWSDRRGRDGL